jgi:hypothetical protein
MIIDLRIYKIYDFLELVFGACTIVASILGIITFFKGQYNKVALFSVVCALVLSIVFFLKILKIKKVSTKRLEVFSESFHRLTDMMRNEFYDMKIQHDKGSLSVDYLLEKLKNCSQASVDILSNCLSVSTTYDIYSTIKYFDTGSPDPHMLDDKLEVTTLCRSFNQPKARIDNDRPSKIIDNTDFLNIFKDSKPHFYATDLRKHSVEIKRTTGSPYQNSNLNWSDQYLSTIVVPIRIKRKYIEPDYGGDGFEIFGFLCVDSKSTSAFQDDDIQHYINLVKAFADCLYKFFDRFIFYQKLVSK